MNLRRGYANILERHSYRPCLQTIYLEKPHGTIAVVLIHPRESEGKLDSGIESNGDVLARSGDHWLCNCANPASEVPHILMKKPVAEGKPTSGHGYRFSPTGVPTPKKHKGVDYSAPAGTPVYAAGDGTIVKLYESKSDGNYIRVEHENNSHTAYDHMQAFVYDPNLSRQPPNSVLSRVPLVRRMKELNSIVGNNSAVVGKFNLKPDGIIARGEPGKCWMIVTIVLRCQLLVIHASQTGAYWGDHVLGSFSRSSVS